MENVRQKCSCPWPRGIGRYFNQTELMGLWQNPSNSSVSSSEPGFGVPPLLGFHRRLTDAAG